MKVNEVRKLVKDLDTSKYLDQEKIWLQLRPVGEKIVPYLVDAYPTTKKWLGRAALVFHCIKYARNNEQAFQLGLNATQDRSTVVRYRACMLLAYSLKKEALPYLERLSKNTDRETAEDASAAIDAINNQNHNYFLDRDHTGKLFLEIGSSKL